MPKRRRDELLAELSAAAPVLDRETKEEIIRAAYLTLLADGRIAAEERKKLKDIAMALRVPEIISAPSWKILRCGSRSRRRSDEASRLAESESMIVSHEHKFIFLKTKKTAGTSIELALTEALRARRRHHAPDQDRRGEARRRRGAQNWRLHGWWGSRGRCSSAAGSNSPPRITASTITCLRRRPAR